MQTLSVQRSLQKCFREKELTSHLDFCNGVFDLITDFIFVLTPSLHLKLMNNAAKSYYHVKTNLYLNQKISNVKFLPKSFSKVIKKLQRLDHISLPIIHVNTIENNLTEQDIEIRWTMSHILNNKKTPIGIFLIGKINLEKFNEKRINHLQSCLNTIVDNVPGDIYWKNINGVYLGCNAAMLRKLKLKSIEDIVGKTDNELWPGSCLAINDQEVITANKTVRIQETVTTNNGTKLYFVSIKTPLRDQNNKIIGIVGNSLDVTDIIEAKAQAEEANNVKSQFLLNMQHDIKTPISHIIGLSNIIASMENLPIQLKEYISYIQISGERLMNLMVDILHYCDLETSTTTEEQEWKFNLLELIQKTRDLNIIPIKEKQLNLIINHDNSIPDSLIGNKNKLHRIMINLLDNAIKFTHQGTITITTKLIKKLEYPRVILELLVEDTGIGIPQDKYEFIFDRFSRLAPSDSNMYKGLGLWMVKQLAKDINGEVYVNSILDQGSQFKLVFPCKVAYFRTI